MNIVFVADSKYALQCGVTLQSFFNSNKGCHTIFVVSTGMEDEDISRLEQMCLEHSSKFLYYAVDESLFDQYDGLSGWSKYTFLKIFIPSVLPESVKKVMYLDVDLLVNGDLQKIYDTVSNEKAVYGEGDIPYERESKNRCCIASDSPYINSGVMIMNLDMWRHRIASWDIKSFISNQKRRGYFVNDQDVINVMFEGSIGRLPCIYNVTNMFFGFRSPLLPSFQKEWKEGRSNPVIMHFTNAGKPWIAGVEHSYKNKWYSVLSQTPFGLNCQLKEIRGGMLSA